MNIYVLDKELVPIGIVDSFMSFIWTDRYDESGDFQLEVAPLIENINLFQIGYFLQISESNHLMIIESVQITQKKDGARLVITGSSLESILNRRIVWGQITFAAKKPVQDVFLKLLRDAFMTSGDRKVENFRFITNEQFAVEPYIADEESSGYGIQFTGDNIYDIVHDLCQENGLGFKIGFYDNEHFDFELYRGVDHSYDNTEDNPYVVFSPKFENLLSSNYLESSKTWKNSTLIMGEGEGSERKSIEVGLGYTGLDRREVFTDARDVSSSSYDEDGNEVIMTESSYANLLAQRGTTTLSDNQETCSFEGEAEARNGFAYGRDFSIGDIVQVEDAYGHMAKCRVAEMIVSYDTSNGYTVYPTFKSITE